MVNSEGNKALEVRWMEMRDGWYQGRIVLKDLWRVVELLRGTSVDEGRQDWFCVFNFHTTTLIWEKEFNSLQEAQDTCAEILLEGLT